MKGVKPGRGPSFMGAIGSLVVSVFGVIWTIMACSMGAPGFFCLFGAVFVIMGIIQMVYNFKNATGKNRFSEFDITENGEEPDPLERFSERGSSFNKNESRSEAGFCPYCGNKVDGSYRFCPKCGRELPR